MILIAGEDHFFVSKPTCHDDTTKPSPVEPGALALMVPADATN